MMKTLRKIGLLLGVLFMSASLGAQDKTLLIFSGIEGSVNSEISMQVLEKAYAKLGLQIQYRPLPGERALRASNSGAVDGEVFRIANIQKRYKNLIPVPTPINSLQALAFTKDKDIVLQDWQSLKRYRIGIQGGIKFAERTTKGMNPVVVDTNKQLFRMLDSGRIDVLIAAESNGLKTLADLRMKGIHALPPLIQPYPLYHYLHKKHAGLVERLDAVLQSMQASGEIRAIRKAYLDQLGVVERGHN